MTLGERIKFVRKSNNLNQSDFAKLLGISQTHVSKIEKNIENPSTTLLILISYMFAIDIEWLKDDKGTSNNKDRFMFIRHNLENQRKYINDDCDFYLTESFLYFEKILSFADKNNSPKMREYFKSFSNILRYICLIGIDKNDLSSFKANKITERDNRISVIKTNQFTL